MNKPLIDEALKRELAVQASCHPKTIAKVLRGEPVRGLAGHRARLILEAAGLLPAETTVDGHK